MLKRYDIGKLVIADLFGKTLHPYMKPRQSRSINKSNDITGFAGALDAMRNENSQKRKAAFAPRKVGILAKETKSMMQILANCERAQKHPRATDEQKRLASGIVETAVAKIDLFLPRNLAMRDPKDWNNPTIVKIPLSFAR